MVTGSFAMSAYGEIRFTRDIDVAIQMTEAHIEDCVAAFKADYYVSEQAIKRALRQASMFNLISNVHGGKIDCIVWRIRRSLARALVIDQRSASRTWNFG